MPPVKKLFIISNNYKKVLFESGFANLLLHLKKGLSFTLSFISSLGKIKLLSFIEKKNVITFLFFVYKGAKKRLNSERSVRVKVVENDVEVDIGIQSVKKAKIYKKKR